jgi:hypothetical protein
MLFMPVHIRRHDKTFQKTKASDWIDIFLCKVPQKRRFIQTENRDSVFYVDQSNNC